MRRQQIEDYIRKSSSTTKATLNTKDMMANGQKKNATTSLGKDLDNNNGETGIQVNSNYYGEIITEYLTNYMCFIVLSVEIFSILFTFGVVKSVVVLLFVDTAIFIGLLVVGLVKMDLRGKEVL